MDGKGRSRVCDSFGVRVGYARSVSSLMNILAITKRSDVGNNRVNFPIQANR